MEAIGFRVKYHLLFLNWFIKQVYKRVETVRKIIEDGEILLNNHKDTYYVKSKMITGTWIIK